MIPSAATRFSWWLSIFALLYGFFGAERCNGNAAATLYGAANRKIPVMLPAAPLLGNANGVPPITQTPYRVAGNALSAICPNGDTSVCAYDAANHHATRTTTATNGNTTADSSDDAETRVPGYFEDARTIAYGYDANRSQAERLQKGVLNGSYGYDPVHRFKLTLGCGEARYYDPESGRFLSPDPMGHGSDMSLYAYCNGDPVNGLDPDGRLASHAYDAARTEVGVDLGTWNKFSSADVTMSILTFEDGFTLGQFSDLHQTANDIIANNPDFAYSRGFGTAGAVIDIGLVGGYGVSTVVEGLSAMGSTARLAWAAGGVTYAFSTPQGQEALQFGEQVVDFAAASETGSPVGSSSLGSGVVSSVVTAAERLELQGGVSIAAETGGQATVDLYRAVSPAEFKDIMSTGTFRAAPGAFEGKQFGLTLGDTIKFADAVPDTAAVIKVTIPQTTFQQLQFSTTIDPFIFKSGVITAQPGAQLNLLNSTVISIEHAF